MRFVDLAMATVIGVSALSTIVAWNPQYGDLGAKQQQTQAALRDSVLQLIDQKGTTWFLQSSVDKICSMLSAMSNSTVDYFASIGYAHCGARPGPGTVVAYLEFRLSGVGVTLGAWSTG